MALDNFNIPLAGTYRFEVSQMVHERLHTVFESSSKNTGI